MNSPRRAGIFGPGERTIISIVTEITIVWLAGWGVSAAWFIGWAGVYLIGPLVYVQLQRWGGVTWGIWERVNGFYYLNWPGLVAWWLVGVPLSGWALVYRFFMEISFKDWLPHPEKPEVVVFAQDVPEVPGPTPTERHRHEFKREDKVGGLDILDEKWENHAAIVRFAQVVHGGKNFSVSVSRDYGVTPTDYDTFTDWMISRNGFDMHTIGHRKTKKLTKKGRRIIQQLADPPAL